MPIDARTSAVSTALHVSRQEIGSTRLVRDQFTDDDLREGQIRMRVDKFAVTANNISYAVFGDQLGYWDFFPTDDPEWGCVPAMGWATVVSSRNDAIAVGSRYYGWYPMASQVTFTAAVVAAGFRDDGAHRAAHAPGYRTYVSTDMDPMYPGADEGIDGSITDAEDRHLLLRGLALTGFLAEEYFADGGGSGQPYFGVSRVIVLSASSKTALGFAHHAARRHFSGTSGGVSSDVEVVGVTSARNRDMVESVGVYNTVVTYDEIGDLRTDGGAVLIDMAGNPSLLRHVHDHFGDGLAYSMTVGRSHHDAAPPSAEPMAGPEPTMFFAPTEVTRRKDQWGDEEYGRRCAAAIVGFTAASRDWLTVEHSAGPLGAQQTWEHVHSGSVRPSVGHVVRMAD